MKQRFMTKLICLPLVCLCGVLFVQAQAVATCWQGKISLADSPVLMHGNIVLQSNGELFTGEGRLELEGDYAGEPGSRAYRYVSGEFSDRNASLFLDVSGTAEGTTEIIPEFDPGWDGTSVALVKAGYSMPAAGTDADNLNARNGVFYIEPVLPDCETLYVQLQYKANETNALWSVSGTRTLPLIKQLRNHTLLADNNPGANGGHSFTYYRWYRDGLLLKEDTHEGHGGSYYTGGAALDAHAAYMVEVTDSRGMHYFSCPYFYVPMTLPASVRLYPNPVSRSDGRVYVEVETLNETMLAGAQIEVYGMMGRYYGNVPVQGRHTIPVDLPRETGIYILKFKSSELETSLKAMVN